VWRAIAVASLRSRDQLQSAPSYLQNATLARIQEVSATSVSSDAGDVVSTKQCRSCDPSNFHSWLQRWISRCVGVAWGYDATSRGGVGYGTMYVPRDRATTRRLHRAVCQQKQSRSRGLCTADVRTSSIVGIRTDTEKDSKGYGICTYRCCPSAYSRHLTLCSSPWLDGI
jgi:hypothetical protein